MEKRYLISTPEEKKEVSGYEYLSNRSKGNGGDCLCNNLKNIRDNKNRTRPNLHIEEIYEYDLNSTSEELNEYCRKADFVFNLAGVNRPENPGGFYERQFRLCFGAVESSEEV